MKDMQLDPVHARWIVFDTNTLELCYARKEDLQNLPETKAKLENLKATLAEYEKVRKREDEGSSSSPNLRRREMLAEMKMLQQLFVIGRRREQIEKLGELCFPVLEYDPKASGCVSHANNGEKVLIFSSRMDFNEAIGDILMQCEDRRTIINTLPWLFFVGIQDSAALFYTAYTFIPKNPTLGSSYITDILTTANIDRERLLRYFSTPSQQKDIVENEISSLQACTLMAEVYHSLAGATISTLVLKQQIHRAKWATKIFHVFHKSRVSYQLFQRLDLIRGTHNIWYS
jgi:hypothetical protein